MPPSTLTPCGGCSAVPGTAHDAGCDVARCMRSGGQRIQCDLCGHCETCTHDSCDRDIWTGLWPGVAECEQFGWWSYFGPDFGEKGWVRCGPEHPGAVHDLNRLHTDARWNPRTRTWVQRQPQAAP